MSPMARPAAWLVRTYQAARSDRPSPCRFTPSCSSYALEALEARGLAVGGSLALRRLARCHPWGEHRYDPVPPSKDASRV